MPKSNWSRPVFPSNVATNCAPVGAATVVVVAGAVVVGGVVVDVVAGTVVVVVAVQAATFTDAGLSPSTTYTYTIAAAGQRGDGTAFFKGSLNGLRFYETALAPAQIAEMFAAGFRPNSEGGEGLAGAWDLADGNGTRIAEKGGRGGIVSGAGFRWIANRTRSTPQTWYVAPGGSPANSGESASSPWDLKTALSHPPPVLAGDTIILADGSVFQPQETVHSFLTGTESAPITVRPQSPPGTFPNTVKIDGARVTRPGSQNVLRIEGAFTDFYDLEIMMSESRRLSSQASSNPTDVPTVSGIWLKGRNIRLFYPHVHDMSANGILAFDPAGDVLIHQPIVYNNGWRDRSGKVYGNGIYTHNGNPEASVTFRDIISFNNYNNSFQHYSSEYEFPSYNLVVDGIHFAREPVIIAGAGPKHNFSIRNGDGYGGGMRIGYGDEDNYEATVSNNYVYAEDPIQVTAWRRLTMTGNTMVGAKSVQSAMQKISRLGDGRYVLSGNTYYRGRTGGKNEQADQYFAVFDPRGRNPVYYTFRDWQALGFDADSRYISGGDPAEPVRPTENAIRYYPDTAGNGRNIAVVWNWEGREQVTLDLTKFGFRRDQRFAVYDATNPAVGEITAGTIRTAAAQILLRLAPVGVARRISDEESTLSPTLPEFGIFLVVRR